MAERLILLYTEKPVPDVLADVDAVTVRSRWEAATSDGRVQTTLLLDVRDSERVMDALHARFEGDEGYRLLLLEVQATLPRPDPAENGDGEGGAAGEPEGTEGTASDEASVPPPDRLSREELYQDVVDAARPSLRYLVLVAIAASVAAFGMLRNDVAIVIGAMVIAPLLGPNIALALAATLADLPLARRALRSGLLGILVALVVALAIGLFGEPSLEIPEIANRTEVRVSNVAIALAAGVAGALSFTSGVPSGIIGVMVAVALLPPLVAAGMLVAAGQIGAGLAAALLLAVNLISVNLAGIATFAVQGISPRTFREERTGRWATLLSVLLWGLLLAALVGLIVLRG